MKRNFLIIVNPIAGGGKGIKAIPAIEKTLNEVNINYRLHLTTKEKNATHILKDIVMLQEYTDIMIVGGDGTIHQAVNGLENHKIPMSIIPMGTGNDFVKNIYLGKNLQEYLDTALHGDIQSIDVGKCNDLLFTNGIGIGFDAAVVAKATQKERMWSGNQVYMQIVLRLIMFFKEKMLSFTIDGKSFRKKVFLLAIANGTTYGGDFKIAPYANVTDGLLDVGLINEIKGFKRLSSLIKLKLEKYDKIPAIEFFKAKEVIVEAQPELVAHADGEFIGCSPFKISILPAYLPLRVRK